MTGLSLRDIRKSYGSVEVLHGIDLDVRQGEFVVFVGPSGCGKSTLLRMIAGLEEISSGTMKIGEAVVNDVPPSKRGIAMVFQSYALYPHKTVFENMAFGLRIARHPKEDIERRVQEAAEMLQLTPYLDRLPKALSGGQRQRVAIGRAICRDPEVFLFDEPLSNLDAALRVATRIEIAKLGEKLSGTTMIYVTHDQVEAMTLADRIVVLSAGRIEQVGTPIELYERPANLFVARFIGSPAMNVIPGRIEDTGDGTVVSLPGGCRAKVPASTGPSDRGRTASYGIRPENLSPARDGEGTLAGTVSVVEHLGEMTLVYVDGIVDGEPVVAKVAGNSSFDVGARISLVAEAEKGHLFDDNGAVFPAGSAR